METKAGRKSRSLSAHSGDYMIAEVMIAVWPLPSAQIHVHRRTLRTSKTLTVRSMTLRRPTVCSM
ncbi:hypothetical protein ABG768_003676 [Culter alburnus]|uniref:Uncharacterized protein n=1 Tax=Culter alburnus TaxID=194366 RepID=A0AAW1ZZ37_CULAL